MDNLEKLEKELYEKDGQDFEKRLKRRIIFPASLKKLSTIWTEQSAPVKSSREFLPKKKLIKFLLWGTGGLAIILAAVFVFFYLGTRGQEAEVTIHDRGPIEAGEVVTIPVAYKNVSSVSLEEAELTIILPEGSFVIEGAREIPAPPRIIKKLGSIGTGKEGVVEISTRMFGREGEEKEIEAILLYRPENLRARFSSKTTKEFRIRSVPLAISWEVPETVSQGQEVVGRIRYTSSAPRPFLNVWLRVEYPSGFSFLSSDPKPNFGNDIWSLGTVEAGKEGSIVFKGTITGEEGEVKSFRAELGLFDQLTKEWKSYRDGTHAVKIAVTPLSIQTLLNGERQRVITPGENLDFLVKYKNNTDFPLKNITVRTELSGVTLNLDTLSIDKGVFDFGTRSVVWGPGSAAELREVAPGQGGEFRFSVRTKEIPVVRGEQDKNPVVSVTSSISAGQTPEALVGTKLSSRETLQFKVRSKIAFVGKTLYRSSPIANSGPIPPKVGERTTYTLVWEVRNFTSDVQNVEVSAVLPPNVKWEENFSPKDSRVNFDLSAGEVRWHAGNIKAGTGVLAPAATLSFQVSIVPSEADIGKELVLLNGSRLTGFDAFIGSNVEEKLELLTTALQEGTSKNSEVVR